MIIGDKIASNISLYIQALLWYHRDHFVNAPSQWEMTLHCNVISHWLGAYTKWSRYHFEWSRWHENMFPCTGSRVNANCDQIASWGGAWFRTQDLWIWQNALWHKYMVELIHHFGAKPFPEWILTYQRFDLWSQNAIKFRSNTKTFFQKNFFF